MGVPAPTWKGEHERVVASAHAGRQARRALRRNATEAERELWWHLRRELPLDGTHFRRQVPIGSSVVDLCYHARHVVIEFDGGGHAEPAQAAADKERDAFLYSRGNRVLRFWNAQVFNETQSVLDTIFAALAGAILER